MKRYLVPLVLATAFSGFASAEEIPLKNWAVPGASAGAHLSTLGDVSSPSTFVSIAPCRIVDTRGGAPLGGGLGPFTSGQTRNYDLNSAAAPCNGIPSGTAGYSLNVTVTNDTGNGFIAVYPTGNPPSPMVSLLNYKASTAVANATIVPCDVNGSITVLNQGASAAVVIDINGYFTNYLNAGEQLWVSTSIDGLAAVVGYNWSNADGSHGVGGFEGGTGVVHGVQGAISASAAAGSSGVHGTAAASTAYASGVLGESLATGPFSAGVSGIEKAAGSDVYGVYGFVSSSSIGAAGVYGVSSSGTASAGYFQNNGAGINTYLGTTGSPGGHVGSYGLWVTGGNTYATGTVYGSTKSFVAPHPTDPSKEIVYTSVEAPSADIYFRGTAQIVNGVATIEVPEHFRVSARPDSYQTNLTVVGGRGSAWVDSEGPEGIVVRGTAQTVHYMVYAERDVIDRQVPVRDNVHFDARALSRGDVRALPAGYLDLLVKNGTLNPDLTLNRRTAERLGWVIPAGVEAR